MSGIEALVGMILGVGMGALIIFWVMRGYNRKPEGLDFLQNQMHEMMRLMDSRLGESTRVMQAQHGEYARTIKDITEELTLLGETNKQVVHFADQLQALQDILKNPKQRGVLGEYYLETVLKNILPAAAYEMQYKVGKNDDGKDLIVDAVIKLQDRVIPIDSKFSLENYNRVIEERNPAERERVEKTFKQDLKNRIDETSKYVRPQDGTMDFALMFIPSEAIYYDLTINQVGAVKVNTQDLIQYALTKRVHIVSPNSFYAFLQTILQGLKQMEIEKSAKEIIKRVEELGRHILAYEQYMTKLGSTLGQTVGTYNTAYKELKKIDKDVLRISGSGGGMDPIVLDRPDIEG
ncbi:MAG: DNA recombination protein RmuC [Patescibacteria group bacterium]